MVSEFLPATIIYPTSLATWLFVALSAVRQTWFGMQVRGIAAAVAAVAGLAASVVAVRVLERTREARRAALELHNDKQYAGRPLRQPVSRHPGWAAVTRRRPRPPAGRSRR